MHKLVFFVPETHLEPVKAALFAAGAGRIGQYDHCAWQTLGQGQFRPLNGSQAFIGKLNEITQVPEYRVEMVCTDQYLHAAINALRQSHPYEEPAFDVWRLADL